MKQIFKQNNGTSKSQQLTSSAAGSTSASASEYSGSRQPPRSTIAGGRLKQAAIVALFAIGLIVCVSSLACILLLPQFVTNQVAKVSIFPLFSSRLFSFTGMTRKKLTENR